MADETHGMRVKIVDVSDPTDPQVISLVGSGVHEWSIPHNLIFDGDLLHVAYYVDGYYVWDLSDPANPSLYAYYDTSEVPHSLGYKGAWGVYPFLSSGRVLVSDMQEGLFVFENGSTNVENTVADDALIFPNPMIGETLMIQSMTGHVSVDIRDHQGRLVYSEEFANTPNNLEISPELTPGCYIVAITENGTTHSTQLIKL